MVEVAACMAAWMVGGASKDAAAIVVVVRCICRYIVLEYENGRTSELDIPTLRASIARALQAQLAEQEWMDKIKAMGLFEGEVRVCVCACVRACVRACAYVRARGCRACTVVERSTKF